MIAIIASNFLMPKISRNFNGYTPNGSTKYTWGTKNFATFDR